MTTNLETHLGGGPGRSRRDSTLGGLTSPDLESLDHLIFLTTKILIVHPKFTFKTTKQWESLIKKSSFTLNVIVYILRRYLTTYIYLFFWYNLVSRTSIVTASPSFSSSHYSSYSCSAEREGPLSLRWNPSDKLFLVTEKKWLVFSNSFINDWWWCTITPKFLFILDQRHTIRYYLYPYFIVTCTYFLVTQRDPHQHTPQVPVSENSRPT